MVRPSIRKWTIWLIVLALAAIAFLPAQAETETPRFDVKLSGVITVVPTTGYPVGAWKVAGQDIVVTAATRCSAEVARRHSRHVGRCDGQTPG